MGISMDKLLIIAMIAIILLGPERLPVYAQKLGEFVKNVRRMAEGAKGRLREEMGEDFDEVDWKQLDPRQYDPRRIIRDAIAEDKREAAIQKRKAEREAARLQREAAVAEARARQGLPPVEAAAGSHPSDSGGADPSRAAAAAEFSASDENQPATAVATGGASIVAAAFAKSRAESAGAVNFDSEAT